GDIPVRWRADGRLIEFPLRLLELRQNLSNRRVFTIDRRVERKRCGGDGAGFELTIGAAADPAAKPLGW
ncbi:MAG TPA: hypothetical protein VMQ99_23160, partial [Acetobacteraceae bacterium]|nr:hypothetical protein [Acetobacteraceae bacterium]